MMLGDRSPAYGPWYIDWSPAAWSHDVHGAMRLYLDHNDQVLIDRVERQDSLTLRAIMADAMSQMAAHLLSGGEAEEIIENAEPNTLASLVAFWLGRAWPRRNINYCRRILDRHPGRFRAAFLGAADPGEDMP